MEEASTHFAVGQEFSSFQSLENAIDAYSKSAAVQLYKRSSRTIKNALQRCPKKVINEALRYSEIDYACVHGGRSYKSTSKGHRPNQSKRRICRTVSDFKSRTNTVLMEMEKPYGKPYGEFTVQFGTVPSKAAFNERGIELNRTFLMGCTFSLKLRASPDGKKLKITHFDSEHHGHNMSEASFSHLPSNRKLSTNEKDDVRQLLKLNANKKLVQQHVKATTGKNVRLKDLHNLARSSPASNAQDIITILKKSEGAVIEVMENQGILEGVFYQRKGWQTLYRMYPELIFIDATYKLNNVNMPLYVLLGLDGNGDTFFICLWFVKNESKPIMKAMLEFFQKHNPSAPATFMADKDWLERGVIRELFPEAHLLICLFHTLRTFRREVTETSMACTSGQRKLYLQVLQSLAYAKNQEEYDELLTRLESIENQKLIRYFMRNWHEIRQEWVLGLTNEAQHLGNHTNNRLEAINQKLKQVMKRNAGLGEFASGLMLCLDSLEQEREARAAMVFEKVNVYQYTGCGSLEEYLKRLTPFAFQKVRSQFEESRSLTVSGEDEEQEHITFGDYTASSRDCNCGFFRTIELTCKHIFAVRTHHLMDLFVDGLCSQHWSKDFYRGQLYSRSSSEISLQVTEAPPRTAIPSEGERYRMAFQVAKQLASTASQLPLREFHKAITVLQDISSFWEQGREFMLLLMDDNPTHTTSDHTPVALPLSTVEEPEAPDSPHVEAPEASDSSDIEAPEASDSSDIEAPEATGSFDIEAPEATGSFDIEAPWIPDSSAIETPTTSQMELNNNKLPKRAPKRGWPKGAEVTVIGLPKRKKGQGSLKPYKDLSSVERGLMILHWIVADADPSELQDLSKIPSSESDLSMQVLDQDVDISEARQHFSVEAWAKVLDLVERKEKSHEWVCSVCRESLSLHTQAISCDRCLSWHHIKCATAKGSVPKGKWFCRSCKA
ncbi:Zinc finger swim domain-containing protein 1 [Plakobranchus ocellatus]|uniref:Zinc finger swim domain-containing protein 1 n=1 Tax=Plakobranchus ocellatus TaxID=259542 RepID=A0AAV3Z6E7_9GAST|nr:Zinc finger swim domain-containing protein 1 [Plakobranchus ocellatus]